MSRIRGKIFNWIFGNDVFFKIHKYKKQMKQEKTLSEKRIEEQIPCPEGRVGCLVYHRRILYKEEDVKQALQEFANILKNNKNPEFKEYNQMLLNSLKEIFGKELVE